MRAKHAMLGIMNTKAIVLCLYLLCVLVGVSIMFVPLPVGMISAIESIGGGGRITLAVSIVYLLLQIMSVALFWSGLHSFKANLRRPYRILCIGVVMIAVAQLQVPVALVLGAQWWFTSGFLLLLYLIPSMLLYGGMRLFARLVGVTGKLTYFRYVLPLAMGIVAASMLLPVSTSTLAPTDIAAHMFVALPLWQAAIGAAAAYLAWRIKHTMGMAYNEAMQGLFAAMVAYTFASFHFAALPFFGYDNPYGTSGAYQAVFVALGTFFVVAGYKFWAIGNRAEAAQNTTPVDVIVYTAGLATNMQEIDPILDELRMLTASLKPGHTLTADQEKVLIKVYVGLEEYLTNQEPLRKLTQAELRQRLADHFPPDSVRLYF